MTKGRRTKDGRHTLRTGEYERSRGGFEYKFKDATGKQCSISAPTLDELRKKEKEVTTSTLTGISVSKGRETLNFYYEKWLSQKRGLKDVTRSSYDYLYSHFVEGDIGKMRIADIKYTTVKAFYGGLRDEKHVAVGTVEKLQNILFQVFEVGVRDDVIRTNPTRQTISDFKRETPREKKGALTPDEQTAILKHINGTRWEPLFGILLRTGLRIGEAAGLCWSDIDVDVIHIRRTLSYYKDLDTKRMVFKVTTPKTDSGERDIPLSDDVKELLDKQRKLAVPCSVEVDGISDFIFTTRFGGVIHSYICNRALERIIRDINEAKEGSVPYTTCHGLRRTYGTNCVRAGVSMPVLMKLMGHRDVDTTLSYYISVHKDMSQVADEKVRQYISEVVSLAK